MPIRELVSVDIYFLYSCTIYYFKYTRTFSRNGRIHRPWNDAKLVYRYACVFFERTDVIICLFFSFDLAFNLPYTPNAVISRALDIISKTQSRPTNIDRAISMSPRADSKKTRKIHVTLRFVRHSIIRNE